MPNETSDRVSKLKSMARRGAIVIYRHKGEIQTGIVRKAQRKTVAVRAAATRGKERHNLRNVPYQDILEIQT